MPRSIPSYRQHKARNLAVVRIDGKDHYLGRHNSPESKAKYHRLIAEWHAGGQTGSDNQVAPVGDYSVTELIAAYWDLLSKVMGAMVRFQRFTVARPGEVCKLRPCDLDRSGEIWTYRPESHKTEHHGHERRVFIGPRGQAILRPYLLRNADHYCFSPRESEDQRRAELHANRQTPLAYGNHPGSNRKRRPKRTARDHHDKDSYRRAIHRACDRAFPAPKPLGRRPGESDRARRRRLTAEQLQELEQWQKDHRWSPNQLRHAAATEIRHKFGLEAAQVALGHSRADVTQVYAERDQRKAVEVMREVG